MSAKYRVKELAKAKGLTQFQLAVKSGVSLPVIQRIWQNRAPEGIRHNTLEAVAAALNVEIKELSVEGSDSEEGAGILSVNRESLIPAAA